MTIPEIAHRLWRGLADRTTGGSSVRRASSLPASRLESLGESIPARWWDPSLLRDSGLAEGITLEADNLLRGEWTVFGQALNLGPHPDWLADPFSGRRSAGESWDAAAPGLSRVETPDIRSIWELNRLQGLVLLGQAFVLTGRESHAEHAAGLIRGWSASNPYLRSVNWRNSLEVSLRAISLLQSALLCRESSLFKEDGFRRELAGLLYLHGHYIRTHLSRGSTALNHLAGEAAGLVALGYCLPDLPGSRSWREDGSRTLEKSLSKLILEDGGPYEGSLHYLAFTCVLAATAAGLAGPRGFALSDISRRKMDAAYRFLCAVTDNGRADIGFGDCDDAAVAGPPASDSMERLRRALNMLALYLHDIPPSHYLFPDPDSPRLFSPAAQGTRSAESDDRPRLEKFARSGHYIVRSPGLFLRFECGHWGAPGAFAHAHADRLSFVLFLDSLPFLIDPGTGAYLADPAYREFFRSTHAHNTVTLNGLSQARPLACFLYREEVRSQFEEATAGDEMIDLAGRVRDYAGIPGLSHSRRLSLETRARRIVIDDRVEGEGGVDAEVCFHFHPDCRVTLEREASSWCILARNGTRELKLVPDQNCDIGLHRAEEYPIRGWYSPGFMRRIPADQVVLTVRDMGASRLRTMISWR